MKKIFKWVAYCAAAFIVLVSGVAGITQTQFFRNALRSFALDQLDTLLTAEVSLGEIHGNLVSGFSIDSVSIKVANEYFIETERIDLRYDIFEIPSKKINVSNLMLVRPRIALLRGRDSVWNFVRMVRPTPDDSTTTPFDWPIAVQRLEIKEGTLRLLDSASLNEPEHEFTESYFVEYHDFAVRDLNLLITNAFITPTEKRLKIESLSGISDKPEIELQKLTGEFRVTKTEADVKQLLIQTSKSKLTLNATMTEFDLLGGIELSDLKSKPVELTLATDKLDFGELKRFIHQLDFLHGTVRSLLVADGEFGKLNVKQLDLHTGNSELHLAGLVSKLDNPSKLLLNIKCRESKVNYADVLSLMPSFDLPDYRSLGMGELEFDFDGEPLDFKTNLTLHTASGSVETQGATLKIGGTESLRYNGEFTARQLDLAAVLRDEKFKSTMNGVVRVSGYGTSLNNLNATVDATLDSSVFGKERMGPSRISFTSSQRKLSGNVKLAIGSMYSDVVAELDRSNMATPAFKIDGTITSLNLAEYFDDPSQNSDLNLDIKAEGNGVEWSKLNGKATLDFSSSRYKEYQIDSGLVQLAIDQRDPKNSSLTISSNLADFRINGEFDLEYMVGLIRYEIASMNLAVGQRFKSLDSTLASSLDVKEVAAFGKRLSAKKKTLNTDYELALKNLEPLSILTGNRSFDAIGTIEGSLHGNYDSLAGNAHLVLKEFFYGNADSGMLIQDGVASLRFNDLLPTNPLADLRLRLRVDAGKMHINRTMLDTLTFGIFYDKEYAGFTIQADYAKDYHLRTNGQIGVADDGVQFTMSRLQTSYKDFLWNVDDGAFVAINQSGLSVRNFMLRRDSQSVFIDGSLLGGTLDATVAGKNLDLTSLRYVIGEEAEPTMRGFEGIASLDARASGTLQSPTYAASLQASSVQFRGFPFGVVKGSLNYSNQILAANLLIDSRASSNTERPDLTVEGTLPINLALSDVEDRLTDAPMNFTLYSDGLQMSLLDPLVPTFNELSGTLKTDLKVTGSPKHPVYAGAISVDDCKFLFVPNNMHYEGITARLQAEGERIRVLGATAKNVPADRKPGREGTLTITGDFLFRDLVPADFNFMINGALVVVNKDTRTSSLSVFGDLFVEIQSPGLHYTGKVERSLLSGPVLVRNSSLVFPPTTSSTRAEAAYSIPVSIIDDTTKRNNDTITTAMSRYFALAEKQLAAKKLEEQHSVSFIDGLRYDLDVECAGGNAEIRMVFNAATNEELLAVIDGNFTITEDGKTWVGKLDVNRASYNFYGKRFAAEGTIMYSGDFLNPDLNITARYEGTRLNPKDEKTEERVLVIYKITGTRFAPKADIAMKINDVDYSAYNGIKSGDLQSDALTYVIVGNFPISRGEANDIAGGLNQAVQSTVVGGATGLFTGALSEFVRQKTGFINSIEFNYETGGTSSSKGFGERADIRLSGTAFKGYWRYGGKILEDPFGNANFSILYSFGDILDRPLLRNLMFEYERKIITSTFGQIETRKDINSARFFYRFSF